MKKIPYGSVLSASDIGPKNSYGWGLNLKNGSLLSHLLSVLGVPHLGARIRNKLVSEILDREGKGKTIVDIGGGIGLTGFYFNQLGYGYLGIDKSKDKIKIARKILKGTNYKNVNFKLADIYQNILPKTKYDYVLCMEVLEHVKNPAKMIKIISRLLNNNGILVISFPSDNWINGLSKEYLGHVVVGYDPEDLKKFIRGTDLKILKMKSFGNSAFGKFVLLIDSFLIKNTPILAGVFFWFFYPVILFDKKLNTLGKPLGYVFVLKKE